MGSLSIFLKNIKNSKRFIIRYGKRLFCLFLVSAIMILAAPPLKADIYMYIDKDGVIHFTNVPTSSSTDYRVYIQEKPDKIYRLYSNNKYDNMIMEASKKHGISFPLLKAIIKTESDFNPRAVSKKGALGLMQIMPINLKSLNIRDPFDPWENIMGGALYFKKMLTRFKGKISLSLAAYNAGPTAVAQYKSIPPYRETRRYVKKVMKHYYSYKQ